jgi:hypothetical protein
VKSGGQPGNTNGSKDNRLITDELRRVVVQGPEKLKKACQKVLDDASDGNLAAFTFLSDRLDGKPHQSNSLTGADGGAIQAEVELSIRPQESLDEYLARKDL